MNVWSCWIFWILESTSWHPGHLVAWEFVRAGRVATWVDWWGYRKERDKEWGVGLHRLHQPRRRRPLTAVVRCQTVLPKKDAWVIGDRWSAMPRHRRGTAKAPRLRTCVSYWSLSHSTVIIQMHDLQHSMPVRFWKDICGENSSSSYATITEHWSLPFVLQPILPASLWILYGLKYTMLIR